MAAKTGFATNHNSNAWSRIQFVNKTMPEMENFRFLYETICDQSGIKCGVGSHRKFAIFLAHNAESRFLRQKVASGKNRQAEGGGRRAVFTRGPKSVVFQHFTTKHC